MKKIPLHWQILIALILAIFYGLYMGDEAVSYVAWMGDVFLRALKMLIIPLIVSSLISGIANIGSGSNLGRLGLKTLSFYVSTSFLAILTGQVLVNIIKPGVGVDRELGYEVEGLSDKDLSLGDTLIEMVPENIFQAFNNNDMLAIIFFSVLFGFFVTRAGQGNRDIMKKAFNAIFDVMMKITMFVIRFTPLGIFGFQSKMILAAWPHPWECIWER